MPPPRIRRFLPTPPPSALIHKYRPSPFRPLAQPTTARTFTTTSQALDWLLPRRTSRTFKDPKGRPRMATGGSTRGTTVTQGDYGLRMRDRDRRISAAQLRVGEEAIRRRLRGTNFKIFPRWHAGTAVYTKGNESRMGTGKGSFDHWACRVPVSRVVFELSSDAHEEVVRDALRLAANKLPGLWEFVKKGDPPVMGITKLGKGVTEQSLTMPRKTMPAELTSKRLPGTDTKGIGGFMTGDMSSPNP